VLEGDVTPAGDYYLVSLGKTGQVRLAAKDVEMVCRTLHEAYERKAAAITSPSAASHVDLAEWCLRQSLLDEARMELAAARTIESEYRRIADVEKRLEFAAKPTAEKTTAPRTASSVATVGAQQLERTMRELPPGTVEHYTAVIQPILMDRCGNARCHGSSSTAQFQLLQPIPGKVPSRRFTQRNLFATLAIVNKEVADDSQLLAMATKPHGPVERAAFKSEDDRQYREIVEWIQSLRPIPKQSPPATVTTNQPATRRQVGNTGEIPGPHATDDERPAANKPERSPPMGRDPFDPEVFNRRYHSGP